MIRRCSQLQITLQVQTGLITLELQLCYCTESENVCTKRIICMYIMSVHFNPVVFKLETRCFSHPLTLSMTRVSSLLVALPSLLHSAINFNCFFIVLIIQYSSSYTNIGIVLRKSLELIFTSLITLIACMRLLHIVVIMTIII